MMRKLLPAHLIVTTGGGPRLAECAVTPQMVLEREVGGSGVDAWFLAIECGSLASLREHRESVERGLAAPCGPFTRFGRHQVPGHFSRSRSSVKTGRLTQQQFDRHGMQIRRGLSSFIQRVVEPVRTTAASAHMSAQSIGVEIDSGTVERARER